jgi:4-hydroxyphenylpyruvate dioxygenase
LETGHRQVVSHAIRQNGIIFVLQSPLSTNDRVYGDHMVMHGDAVKDVAFTVDDVRGVYEVFFNTFNI